MGVNHSARTGGKVEIYFPFFNMKVYSVVSLELPHRGNSNETTEYTVFNIKQKSHYIISNLQVCFFPVDSRTSSKQP